MLAVAVVVILPITVTTGQNTTHPRSSDKAALFHDCGLDKLSDTERNNLFLVILNHYSGAELSNSAQNFMRKNGWESIEVLGYRMIDLSGSGFETEYLIVDYAGREEILDPSIGKPYLQRGHYWVKAGSMRWEIIAPDGEVLDFWHKDRR